MVETKRTSWWRYALVICALFSLGLAACSASTETKQGALGEYCNHRDTDCRPGLICTNSVCTVSNPLISRACRQSCAKITSCGLDDLHCPSECAKTLKAWSDTVIDQFTGCITQELSCAELGATDNDAAQICYDRLELDEERVQRCREFKSTLLECQPDGDTAEFENRCLRMARTVDGETWARTDACAGLDACTESVECINEVFALSQTGAL